MAWRIPLIEGKTRRVKLRARPETFSFSRILTLIRQYSGLTPLRLRKPDSMNEQESEIRNVAIYLADFYPRTPYDELAEYFSVSIDWVEKVCRDPYANCNLRILSNLQGEIEKSLDVFVALNLESDRMLTVYEQDELNGSFTGSESDDGFYVSSIRVCDLQKADDRARKELEEFYDQKALYFDEELFCFDNGHPVRWNVCPWKSE